MNAATQKKKKENNKGIDFQFNDEMLWCMHLSAIYAN